MTKLKLVKNAHLETLGDILTIVHYDTTILRYDITTKKADVLRGLSPTSNKQINYFLEAFDVKEIIDQNENFEKYDKNHFSQPLDY